jgi:stage V sporulation protein G
MSKMNITEVKVYLVKNNQSKDKRLKAYATIVFENCFIVRDLKIILGNDGNVFVSMPSRRSKMGTFKDIAHPLNATMRGEIERAIFAEYEKAEQDSAKNGGGNGGYQNNSYDGGDE